MLTVIRDGPKVGKTVSSSWWAVISLSVGESQPIHNRYSYNSSRLLLIAYGLLLTVFVPLYQNQILIGLLKAEEKFTFKTKLDLAQLVQSGHRNLIVLDGWTWHRILMQSTHYSDTVLRKALHINPPIVVSNITQAKSELLKPEARSAVLVGIREKDALLGSAYLCGMSLGLQADSDMNSEPGGLLFSKNHPAVKVFNEWVKINHDYISYVTRKYTREAKNRQQYYLSQCSTGSYEDSKPVTLGRLLGACFLFICGVMVGCFVFLVEKVRWLISIKLINRLWMNRRRTPRRCEEEPNRTPRNVKENENDSPKV